MLAKKETRDSHLPDLLCMLLFYLYSDLEYGNLVLKSFHILIQYTCSSAQLLHMVQKLIGHIVDGLGTACGLFNDIGDILHGCHSSATLTVCLLRAYHDIFQSLDQLAHTLLHLAEYCDHFFHSFGLEFYHCFRLACTSPRCSGSGL